MNTHLTVDHRAAADSPVVSARNLCVVEAVPVTVRIRTVGHRFNSRLATQNLEGVEVPLIATEPKNGNRVEFQTAPVCRRTDQGALNRTVISLSPIRIARRKLLVLFGETSCVGLFPSPCLFRPWATGSDNLVVRVLGTMAPPNHPEQCRVDSFRAHAAVITGEVGH